LQRQLNQAGGIIKEEKEKRQEAEYKTLDWKFMFWTAVAAAVICFFIAFHIVGFWQPFIQFCIGIVVLLFVLYVIDKIQSNPIMSSFIAGCVGLIGLIMWLMLR
jgi:small-conductance mechanosensitive channel